MRRVAASVAVLLAVPALIALPVVTGPQAQIRPVTPTVAHLALTGVDPVALATSRAPDPEHDHGHDAIDDGAAPDAPATEAAHDEAAHDEAAHDDAAPAKVAATQAPHAEEPEPGPAVPLEPAAVTPPTDTAPFSLVAVSWTGEAPAGTTVQVRVREKDGVWTDWQELGSGAEHGPDPGTAEAEAAGLRHGTDPLLTAGGSDGVQVRIDSPGGVLPADASVSLVDPKTSEADVLAASTPPATAVAAGDPLKPSIITRAQWGADESLRGSAPVYTGPIKVGFVHHTASTNNYTADTAAAQVRALYAYFTLSLGYSDIAYNFFVDRFGRLYEGRAGGMDKNVLGGHTAGFNQNTFAVSALGNFDIYKPTSNEGTAMATAMARLLAWKLALNHADPSGTASLVSNSGAGTSKYEPGQTAVVPVISGHRDIGLTACPGQYLESYLPSIRTQAKAFMGTQLLNPALAPSVSPYAGTGGSISTRATGAVSWKLEVFSPCLATPIRTVTGSLASAGTVTATWNQRRADGSAAPPGTYRMVLSATAGDGVPYPVSKTFVVTETATSPLGPCTQVARVAESERYAAAVRVGRIAAPSSKVVVLAPGSDAYEPEALVAAPLAAAKKAPLLLTGTASVPAAVVTEIKRRGATTAYVVGTSTQVSSAVITQLRSLGVTTITRLSGTTRSATATAVAGAMGQRTKAVVVSFSSGSSSDVNAAASAAAASLDRPLLVVAPTSAPAVTLAAMKTLGITSTTVVGSSTAISAAVVTAVKGTRVTGSDAAATSVALLAALAPSATKVSALPTGSGYGRAVAAGARRPLVLGAGGTAGIARWLTTATAVHVLAVAPTAVWADSALTPMVTSITSRTAAPAPTPTPTTTPAPATAAATTVTPSVPTGFVFNGAGYGHGVGMSQYGARGMALEGKTATEIVTHYYTGTTVTPVKDDAAIRVNLLHRATKALFRTEALTTGGGGIEVTLAGQDPELGTSADIFSVVQAGSSVTVIKTRGTATRTLGTAASVTIRWEGTRDPGGAGTTPTVLNVVPEKQANFASEGHRYRYGTVIVQSASAGTFQVNNRVRIHDEYLLGIAEVSNSWPAASLQAQVLAARSYVLSKAGTLRSACLCHVDDGGGPYYDQTFAGWIKESGALGQNWRDAVKATYANTTVAGETVLRGKAILSGGQPITAFYYAASGGRTQSSADVWGGVLPWAQSVDDHWSLDASVPWSQWIPRERTQAQVAAAFGLPDVMRIDLSARTAGDGVRTAIAWSSSGASATISGESLRTRLSLPGTWVSRVADVRSGDAATIAVRTAQKSSSETVVLAPIADPASVAVAGNLAAQEGWALLLTTSDALSAVTRTELARRTPTTVYAVGTPTDLPAALVSDVGAMAGVGTVTRVTGTNATGVSVNAAKLLAPATGAVAVVVGETDLGSLAVGSGAARAKKGPLLVVPGGAAPSTSVPAYLDALAPKATVVIGSTDAVADSVAATLPQVSRLAGADAVETASKAATWAGSANARLVVLGKALAPVSAVALAPGAVVLVVDTSVATSTKVVLQRGVATIVAGPNMPDALVTTARRL
ncbi:cell wall-binding repeat-containing protein [Longivirga aurantiaca]|uniref:Cell wall-binding repeat-containing protein n=1 Tax=Longivirga aurantiaca TaxID=1837743 RepID=A0ABW1SX61_9ACTN